MTAGPHNQGPHRLIVQDHRLRTANIAAGQVQDPIVLHLAVDMEISHTTKAVVTHPVIVHAIHSATDPMTGTPVPEIRQEIVKCHLTDVGPVLPLHAISGEIPGHKWADCYKLQDAMRDGQLTLAAIKDKSF